MIASIQATLALACVCSSVLWGAPIDKDARDLGRAYQLYEDQKYAGAADVLQDLIGRAPNNADAHRLLGRVYFELDRPDQARRSFVRAIENGKLSPDVLAYLVKIDRHSDRVGPLLNELRMLMVVDPENDSWQLLEAETLWRLGRHDQAQQVHEQLAQANPSNPELSLRLGSVLLEQGHKQKAVMALEVAFYLGSDVEELPETIAEIWFDLGHPQHALFWYEQSSGGEDWQNRSPQAALRCAQIYFIDQHLERAQSIAQPLAESPDSKIASDAVLLLGQIAIKRKQPDQAARLWQRATRLGLNRPDIVKFLASYHINAGRYRQAEAYLQQAYNPQSPDRDVLHHLIASLTHNGRLGLAKDNLRSYIEHFGFDDTAKSLIRLFDTRLLGDAVENGSEKH